MSPPTPKPKRTKGQGGAQAPQKAKTAPGEKGKNPPSAGRRSFRFRQRFGKAPENTFYSASAAAASVSAVKSAVFIRPNTVPSTTTR